MTEVFGLIAAFFTTASFLPQAIHTWKTRDTSGISLTMYLMFTVGVFFWMIYGILLQKPAIAGANAITFFLALSVLVIKIQNSRKR